MSYFSLPKGIVRKDKAGAFVPKSMVDTLFDYGEFLKKNPCIAKSGPSKKKSVAIIGAGASGLVAAYELSKVNNIEVTVFEANDRLGGRMDSIRVQDHGHNEKIFEMGCMRFPPTSYTLFHYLKKFKLKPIGQFPDPGKVPTKLFYQDKVIDWKKGESAPENKDFQRIGKDFGNIVVSLLGDPHKVNTVNPKKLYDFWAIYQKDPSKIDGLKQAWQKILNRFKDTTYFDAVFTLAQDTKIVEKAWTQEDMNKFGALGVGSGGFGPLYVVNFVEILRLFANAWEDNQQFLEQGIGALVVKFNEAILNQGATIIFNKKITKIIEHPGKKYTLSFTYGEDRSFDSIIVATTTRSMEYMGLTLGKEPKSLLKQGPKVAIRDLHLMNSSKLFVTTRSKFWYKENNSLKKDLPSNMQTDELMRGLYCLNYDSDSKNPKKGKGVVLISYVWGDDSSKLLALTEEERYQQFLKAIEKIDTDFAKLLDEQREEMRYIDWENTTNFYGAFKLNYPGQEDANRDAFFQFQETNKGVFIAGDSVSWAGGWLEGAMPTGINAACAVVNHLGGESVKNSPLDIPGHQYNYSSPPKAYRRYEPRGSYLETSENVTVTLTCQAKKKDGSWLAQELQIQDLEGGLANIDGQLLPIEDPDPKKGYVPSGSYKKTCKNIQITLSATCQKKNKNWEQSTLNITDYEAYPAKVVNNNGKLLIK